MPGHERFKGMLTIPYCTPSGVVKMKMRCIQEHDCKDFSHPKYDGPSGPARLYGVSTLLQGGDVAVVCEGEFDAIVANSRLGVAAIGTPGTTWLDHWPRTLADFDRVLVVCDNDLKDDGSNPGLKHAKKVQQTVNGAELVMPPAGEDLSSWIQRDGADEVKKAMGL